MINISSYVFNYYLTRKNIISIKISTLICKFSNPAVINHVNVYIVQMECTDGCVAHRGILYVL